MSGYRFDVEYRPGQLNLAADALTRNFNAKKNYGYVNSIAIQDNLLEKLHKEMGCPGITRLFHQVKIRNLPYSLADVTKVCKSCGSCSELKPKFYRPTPGQLVKATQPFERIAVDFKGPLPRSKSSNNRFILTIVDEYSRFVWAFPCKDKSTQGCHAVLAGFPYSACQNPLLSPTVIKNFPLRFPYIYLNFPYKIQISPYIMFCEISVNSQTNA